MAEQIDPKTQAYVIRIGNRFFHKMSNARVTTAWSLAGAYMFMSREDMDDTMKRLKARGKVAEVKIVSLNQ